MPTARPRSRCPSAPAKLTTRKWMRRRRPPARRRPSMNKFAWLALALAVLSGCSLAPPLVLPDVPAAQAYKEAAPWMPAAPADAAPRAQWWLGYGDAQLDRLQQQLIANSPDLAAALAHYRQAQAYSAELHSGLFPDIALSAGAQRDRQSNTKPPAGRG